MTKKLNYTAVLSVFMFFWLAVCFCPTNAEGRILAGSKTEKKLNKKVQSLLKTARRQNKGGKIQNALDTYWKILELDPSQGAAYLELGEMYVRLKMYDRAVELLEPGIEYSADYEDKDTLCYYYCVLAKVYQKASNSGKANRALIKAAQIAPQNPITREALGDIYFAKNRVADAIKAYKRALELDPSYASAQTKLNNLIAEYGSNPPTSPKKAEPKPTDKKFLTAKITEKDKIAQTAAEKAADIGLNKLNAENANFNKEQPAKAPKDARPKEQETQAKEAEQTKQAPAPKQAEQAEQAIQANDAKQTDEAKQADEAEQTKQAAQTEQAAQTKQAEQTEQTGQAAQAEQAEQTEQAEQAGQAPSEALPVKPNRDEVQNQINLLLAGDEAQKEAAADFFVSMKEEGLAAVEELIYDPSPEVRVIAIRALLKFKNFEQQVADIYKDALDDEDPMVKRELTKAIGEL